MAEMEQCIVCGRVRPVSRMRYGKYDREVGKDVYDGSSVRRGSGHSASFGSSGRTRITNSSSSGARSGHSVRRRFRSVKGYACRYHGLLGRIVTRLLIVGIVLFFGYGYLANKFGGGQHLHRRADPSTALSDGGTAARPSESDTSTSEQQSSFPSSDHTPSSRETSAPASTLIADPSSEPRVSDAMKEALTTGEAQRWHVHKLHGYAVPSAPDSSGCRMVQVLIDETGDKSSASKLCP